MVSSQMSFFVSCFVVFLRDAAFFDGYGLQAIARLERLSGVYGLRSESMRISQMTSAFVFCVRGAL